VTDMTRKLFAEIGWGKFFLLWAFSLGFGFSNRTGGETTLALHLLTALNDQYYSIFAILPIILFFCASVMEDDTEIVILRYGRYGCYFTAKWRALTQLCGVAWLGQMAILLLSGWGLSLANGWAMDSWSNLESDKFLLLERVFPNPYIALLCAAFYIMIGYFLIGLLALWLGHFLSRSAAIKVFVFLYVLTVLWIKVPAIAETPFSFLIYLNHWVMLSHNLTELWRFPLTITMTLLLVVGILWSVHQRWRRGAASIQGSWKGLAIYYQRALFSRGNMILLTGTITLSAVWALVSNGPFADGSEWVIRLLAGHGTGYFNMMAFLASIMVQVIPLWPIGGLFSQVINGKGAFQIVRLRQRKELLKALLYVSLRWLIMSGTLLLGAEVVPPLLLSVPFDIKFAVIGAGLRILDMGFQLLFLLAILCYTGQAAAGFLCILASHFLCVLPIPWLPVGISSLLRISLPETGGIIPISIAATELITGCVLILVWLERLGVQRLFKRNGGLL